MPTPAPRSSFRTPTDRAISAAAGIVVTEMNTPIRALARASVSETTPTIPARTATTIENKFGLSIREETGRTPTKYSFGVCPDQRITRPKSRVSDHGGEESGEQGEEAPQYRPLGSFVDAEGHAHDRVVFRPHDHGPDDQDLRIGEDADRADQPGDGQEDVETGGVNGVRADPGLDEFPDGCLSRCTTKMLRGGRRRFPRVASTYSMATSTSPSSWKACSCRNTELADPAVRRTAPRRCLAPGGAGENEQVGNAGVGGECLEQARRSGRAR